MAPSVNESALAEWRAKRDTLLGILQHCADLCYREGRINQPPLDHKQQKYFQSGFCATLLCNCQAHRISNLIETYKLKHDTFQANFGVLASYCNYYE